MGIEPSKNAQRLVPKVIAVGAELSANAASGFATAALTAANPALGAAWIGVIAFFLTVKNWSQGVTAAEGQVTVEKRLTDLIAKHKSLRGAVDELATDQHMHELISRERFDDPQAASQAMNVLSFAKLDTLRWTWWAAERSLKFCGSFCSVRSSRKQERAEPLEPQLQ